VDVVPVGVSSVDVVPVVVVSSGTVVSSVVNVVSSVVEGYGQSFSGSLAGQFNVRSKAIKRSISRGFLHN
jgi:hypothetical protein